MPSRILAVVLFLAIALNTVALIAEDSSSILSTLPVPPNAKVIKTAAPHGDQMMLFGVTGEDSKTVSWIVKELKSRGWNITNEKRSPVGSEGIQAKKGNSRLSVTFARTGSMVLITYAIIDSTH